MAAGAFGGHTVEIRVLGPLQASVDGRDVEVAAPKVRTVLAMLVIRPGEVVSDAALVEGLRGDEPTEGAVASLRTYVSQLRRALGVDVIQTHAVGYRLAVDPQSVDARRFEALVAEGRPAEALELWRGPALEEFASAPVARTEAARLDELALVATEEAVDAELARGRHAEVVGRLRALVAAHPLRERLWSQLMVALYRAGRGAEALGAYRELRGRLADELGIDPSPALRRLSEAVAVQDPSLDWRPPAPASTPTPNLPPALGLGEETLQEVADHYGLAADEIAIDPEWLARRKPQR